MSDSKYVVNALQNLELVGLISSASTIHTYLHTLQKLIWNRKQPFFIGHIRSHSGLPGPLTNSNQLADLATRDPHVFNAIEDAKSFHDKFHVNASTLRMRFNITKAAARDVIKSCSRCVTLLPSPSLGVNPKGLKPNHIWQMDVTHYAEFGKLQFIHVSIDTFSGFIIPSLHSGEKTKDVIAHCLHSFSVLGAPTQIKTDNGSGYTSSMFKQFCTTFGVQHITGIPYNPQGQSIVARAHLTIKNALYKQKGGIGDSYRSLEANYPQSYLS